MYLFYSDTPRLTRISGYAILRLTQFKKSKNNILKPVPKFPLPVWQWSDGQMEREYCRDMTSLERSGNAAAGQLPVSVAGTALYRYVLTARGLCESSAASGAASAVM
jgi:hypothetical protein